MIDSQYERILNYLYNLPIENLKNFLSLVGSLAVSFITTLVLNKDSRLYNGTLLYFDNIVRFYTVYTIYFFFIGVNIFLEGKRNDKAIFVFFWAFIMSVIFITISKKLSDVYKEEYIYEKLNCPKSRDKEVLNIKILTFFLVNQPLLAVSKKDNAKAEHIEKTGIFKNLKTKWGELRVRRMLKKHKHCSSKYLDCRTKIPFWESIRICGSFFWVALFILVLNIIFALSPFTTAK